MARYRLRFLLQEIDLPRGATLLGRSPECHVTLEDPLVSREHARIAIYEQSATCEDLGSRNGVKINGLAMKGPTRLKDGDRVRIGTRRSPLALWQAHHVRDLLLARDPELTVELIEIVTEGDRILDRLPGPAESHRGDRAVSGCRALRPLDPR